MLSASAGHGRRQCAHHPPIPGGLLTCKTRKINTNIVTTAAARKPAVHLTCETRRCCRPITTNIQPIETDTPVPQSITPGATMPIILPMVDARPEITNASTAAPIAADAIAVASGPRELEESEFEDGGWGGKALPLSTNRFVRRADAGRLKQIALSDELESAPNQQIRRQCHIIHVQGNRRPARV